MMPVERSENAHVRHERGSRGDKATQCAERILANCDEPLRWEKTGLFQGWYRGAIYHTNLKRRLRGAHPCSRHRNPQESVHARLIKLTSSTIVTKTALSSDAVVAP